MSGASVEALRNFQAGYSPSPAAPTAIIRALRDWRDENARAAAQHLDDLSVAATRIPGQPTSREQDEALARATEHIAEGVDIGGLTSWHGSGKIFNKFDPKFMGTGEGNQAFSAGAYLAGARPTAREYADVLGKKIYVGDKELVKKATQDYNPDWSEAEFLLHDAGGNLENVIRQHQWGSHMDVRAAPDLAQQNRQIAMELAAMRGKVRVDQGGQVYTVDLPDTHVANMLDWDKPLTQQAPQVIKGLAATEHPFVQQALREGTTGGDLMGNLLYGGDAQRWTLFAPVLHAGAAGHPRCEVPSTENHAPLM